MSQFVKFQSNAVAAVFALLLSSLFVGISVGPAEAASLSGLMI